MIDKFVVYTIVKLYTILSTGETNFVCKKFDLNFLECIPWLENAKGGGGGWHWPYLETKDEEPWPCKLCFCIVKYYYLSEL